MRKKNIIRKIFIFFAKGLIKMMHRIILIYGLLVTKFQPSLASILEDVGKQNQNNKPKITKTKTKQRNKKKQKQHNKTTQQQKNRNKTTQEKRKRNNNYKHTELENNAKFKSNTK